MHPAHPRVNLNISEDKPRGLTLIGMAGVGKSTVGRILASRLGFSFLDVDDWMRLQEGMQMDEVTARMGPAYVQQLEETCLRCTPLRSTVVSTPGSGIYTNAYDLLSTETVLIHLFAPLQAIEDRIKEDTGPIRVLTNLGPGGLPQLYKDRMVVYRKWTALEVDTTSSPVEKIADSVETLYRAATTTNQ